MNISVFDLLKKKISGFVEKLGGKEEKPSPPPKEEKLREETKKKKEVPSKVEVKETAKEPLPEKTGEAKHVTEKKIETKKPKKETPKPKKIEVPKVKEKPNAEKKALEKPKEEVPKEAEKKEEPTPEVKVEEQKETPEQKADVPLQKPETPKEPKTEEKPEPAKEKKEEHVKEIKEPIKAPKVEEGTPQKKRGLLDKLLGSKKEKKEPESKEAPKPEERVEEVVPPKRKVPKEKEEQAKKKEEDLKKKVKKGLFASVKETITGESEIKEGEIGELLDELELGMLESDVALSVAEEIKEDLRKRIIGSKVKRGQTAIFVNDSLREILLKMFQETPGFDIVQKIGEKDKPCRIMVVGPNGAGKTTTIAKLVTLLQNSGLGVCVAASDTFRAAAVEQLVYHGNKLGIKVVHGAYGSDPTSIAFDAVNYAKANALDVVLIDTAGRQETNVNLLNQLKKMDRIIKPEFKIYVGESIAGNAVVEQISRFNGDIGLDGVILTKLDCDAKGGTVISVSRVAQLPILYVGVGQGYNDLKPFVAEEIVGEILS